MNIILLLYQFLNIQNQEFNSNIDYNQQRFDKLNNNSNSKFKQLYMNNQLFNSSSVTFEQKINIQYKQHSLNISHLGSKVQSKTEQELILAPPQNDLFLLKKSEQNLTVPVCENVCNQLLLMFQNKQNQTFNSRFLIIELIDNRNIIQSRNIKFTLNSALNYQNQEKIFSDITAKTINQIKEDLKFLSRKENINNTIDMKLFMQQDESNDVNYVKIPKLIKETLENFTFVNKNIDYLYLIGDFSKENLTKQIEQEIIKTKRNGIEEINNSTTNDLFEVNLKKLNDTTSTSTSNSTVSTKQTKESTSLKVSSLINLFKPSNSFCRKKAKNISYSYRLKQKSLSSDAPMTNVMAYSIPKDPMSTSPTGEDALSYSDNSQVICDGVGAWRNQGIDVQHFSNALCVNTNEQLQEHLNCDSEVDSIIEAAIKQGLSQASKHTGTSTIAVGVLVTEDAHKVLYTGNIGDSGYVIHRETNLVQKSEATQESFNLPHQLGTNGHKVNDTLVLNRHTVEHGDLILFGTDGLWDNVQNNELNEEINRNTNFGSLAMDVSVLAKNHALDADKLSPFAQGQNKENGINSTGGKDDDITVIAVQII